MTFHLCVDIHWITQLSLCPTQAPPYTPPRLGILTHVCTSQALHLQGDWPALSAPDTGGTQATTCMPGYMGTTGQ